MLQHCMVIMVYHRAPKWEEIQLCILPVELLDRLAIGTDTDRPKRMAADMRGP
jgi:hypothetical protein